ncbi:MAG TPA: hypothetical protein VFH51_03965 [Myxococcota bacterium]|nr:hypothetical protein [Myxococcota bacterium]
MPRLPLRLGGARAPDLQAGAAVGQAAIALYEWNEHAKWGRFLGETERELFVTLSEEMARPHTGSTPETPSAAEEPDAESGEEAP